MSRHPYTEMSLEEYQPRSRSIFFYLKFKRKLVVLLLLFGTGLCLIYTQRPQSLSGLSFDDGYHKVDSLEDDSSNKEDINSGNREDMDSDIKEDSDVLAKDDSSNKEDEDVLAKDESSNKEDEDVLAKDESSNKEDEDVLAKDDSINKEDVDSGKKEDMDLGNRENTDVFAKALISAVRDRRLRSTDSAIFDMYFKPETTTFVPQTTTQHQKLYNHSTSTTKLPNDIQLQQLAVQLDHLAPITSPVPEVSKSQSNPDWTWSCQESRCVRLTADAIYPIERPMDLTTCNMVCSPSPIWPKPTGKLHLTKEIIPIDINTFSLEIPSKTSGKVRAHLEEAFELLKNDTLKLYKANSKSKDTRRFYVRVSIRGSGDPRMRVKTKENYKLDLKIYGNNVVVNITAKSFCGARHGLETLSQLIWFDPYHGSLVTFSSAVIDDAPAMSYRGLLLDTARHFFPVSDIIRTLDAMAASKMNTFHWHATDSQSFPLMLKSVPSLAKHGAYGPKQIYTPEDVKIIVRHARLRGIRVVIEIDVPAHVGYAWSWGSKGNYGELAYCVDKYPWNHWCGEPPCGQLNPYNEHVFTLLKHIYAEIIELTEVDDVFHLGGDEVNMQCWNANLHLRRSYLEVWWDFTQKAKQALMSANNGKLPELTILWSSKLTAGEFLEKMFYNEYTVQMWGSSRERHMHEIGNSSLKTIMSQISAWYLDCGFGSWRDPSGGHCPKYHDWRLVYNNMPWMTYPNWKVQGGTVCMWTELVGSLDLDTRIWPRAAAAAERLWSDPDNAASDDEYLRMDMHRARLLARGINAAPIWPRWCTENPYECLNRS